jgi:pimeloyl-ACP methyl ester carboxylesterase
MAMPTVSSAPTRRQLLRTTALGIAAAGTAGLFALAPAAAAASDAIRPFRAAMPEADLADLRRRLAATRWPDAETDRSQGVGLATLQELVRYWGTDYDWRKAEARLNALPQFVTTIDGVDIHFIHVTSRHAGAMPLIMTHGWPGSVFELIKTVAPLTDPTSHGGRPEEAFDLVLPSMPGYGFSGKPMGTGWDPDRIARAWSNLMQRLGYSRYVAQGGDWGSPVSTAMARQAPAGLLGIHINLPAAVPAEVAAVVPVGGPAPPLLSAGEREVFEALVASAKLGNTAYVAMMTARPQTIGYGVTDSPAGLAAWLLGHPGFARWRFGADPEQSPSKDEVLDDITLYWLTNSGASAGRLYWENAGRSVTSATAQKTAEISLPVAITVFPNEVYRTPQTWARRAFRNLVYFNEVDRGGHFAAWEEPELFSAELRAAFSSLR